MLFLANQSFKSIPQCFVLFFTNDCTVNSMFLPVINTRPLPANDHSNIKGHEAKIHHGVPGRKCSIWEGEINDAFAEFGRKDTHSELHADGYGKAILAIIYGKTCDTVYSIYRSPLSPRP